MTLTRKNSITLAAVLAVALAGCKSQPSQKDARGAAKDRWAATRSSIHYSMAQQQFDNGDLDKAEQTCLQAMRVDPKNVACHELTARIYIERSQLEKAYYMLEKAVELDPKRADSHMLMGVILERWQRYDGALAAFETAYAMKPDSTPGLLAASQMLVKLDRIDEAVIRLEEKTIYFANNAQIRVELGRLYVLRREFPRAIACFREAVVLEPEATRIVEHLAMALGAAGMHGEAIDLLKGLLADEKNAERDDLRVALADGYMATGKPVEARAIYLKVVQRHDHDVNAWIKLGQAALIVEDHVRMHQAAERITTLAPDRHEGYLLRGLIEQKAGRYEAAAKQFEIAALKAPELSNPLLLKGVALEKSGERAAAAEAYRKALEIKPDDDRAQRLLAGVTPE